MRVKYRNRSYYIVVPLTLAGYLDTHFVTDAQHAVYSGEWRNIAVPWTYAYNSLASIPAWNILVCLYACMCVDCGSYALMKISLMMSMQGFLVFVIGNVIQFDSHRILSLLASKTRTKARYRIPRGGLFEYVSCPHYFAEIVIYTGLALASTPFNWRSWYPFVWVVGYA